jgi:MFS family permease
MTDAAAQTSAPPASTQGTPAQGTPVQGTPVLRVTLVILCGVVVALNVGKIPPSLPSLRDELMLSLVAAGLVVSALNVVGATSGGVIGLMIDRFGARRLVGAALLAAALGNAIGALAHAAPLLILGRLIEGVGFILTLSASPVLLQRLAAPKDRGLVMGFWGAFLPTASDIAVAAAPSLLAAGGWRLVWALLGGAAVVALAAFVAVEFRAPQPPRMGASKLADLGRAARTPALLWLGLAFAAFSFNYIGVLSFLPTWLIETQGLGLGVGAAAVIAYSAGNALGNVTGGMLLKRGVSPGHLIAASAAIGGVLALVMFLPGPPIELRLAAAVLFGAIGGWIPVSSFATAPRLAPEPRLAGAAMGLVVQLLNVGTLLGPVALTSAVDAAGSWSAAAGVLLAGSIVSCVAGLALAPHVRALTKG